MSNGIPWIYFIDPNGKAIKCHDLLPELDYHEIIEISEDETEQYFIERNKKLDELATKGSVKAKWK
jgi:hypothetical protein